MSTVEEYIHAQPITLPLRHSGNKDIIELTKLSVMCKACGKATVDIKGSVTEHAPCLELEIAGLCHPCRRVTWARFRAYADHLLAWKDEGIQEYRFKKSWKQKVKSWLLAAKQLLT